MAKQILSSSEKDCRVVISIAEGCVAFIAEQFANLLRGVAVIYVETTIRSAGFIGSANSAFVSLREQHGIELLRRDAVALKPLSPPANLATSLNVGPLPICLQPLRVAFFVSALSLQIFLMIRSLIRLLLGDLLWPFSPRQYRLFVPSIVHSVIQRVKVAVTALTHESDVITGSLSIGEI